MTSGSQKMEKMNSSLYYTALPYKQILQLNAEWRELQINLETIVRIKLTMFHFLEYVMENLLNYQPR